MIAPSLVIAVIRHGSDEYRQAVELRDAVLRRPLGLRLNEEELAVESQPAYVHIAALRDGAVIGTVLMIRESETVARMRQFAIAPPFQKQGLGGQIIAFAEEIAQEWGGSELWLNARMTAAGFYDRMGYDREGDEFIEHTIAHIRMRKAL